MQYVIMVLSCFLIIVTLLLIPLYAYFSPDCDIDSIQEDKTWKADVDDEQGKNNVLMKLIP
jgi:hypothetical protein